MNVINHLQKTSMQWVWILILLGCKKGNDNKESNFIDATPTAVVTATIDGQEFRAIGSEVSVGYDSLVGRYKLIAINSQGRKLIIEMAGIQVSQNNLDFDNFLIALQKDSILFDGGNNPQGFIDISSVTSNKVSGTFSATLKNLFSAEEVIISDGIITTVPF